MKKLLRFTSSTVTVLLFAALICMIIVVISSKASGGSPSAMGYEIKSVLSGSMEPTFQTGSIIAIKPTEENGTEYQDGDIITFQQDQETLVTHRIIGVNETNDQIVYETKGDNNDAADMDPVLDTNVVGEYTGFTIPYVGYFIEFANSPTGALVLLVTPGVIIFLYGILSIWRELKKLEAKTKSASASEPPD
ncbi:signal peptidase I SipW [Salibacterium qingdaonense]|uniref:Signal peptidase I n=1 Tax=Salibacterium qingdaonense TaxID=266892 RepID=A0A1I4LAX6_9BACI|nr:signal peptidase I [Salibacterium qingdaonense]SFL88071.1 signal peptidase, endoplasmic reticulum-type [Salibacterium qingdaonense]